MNHLSLNNICSPLEKMRKNKHIAGILLASLLLTAGLLVWRTHSAPKAEAEEIPPVRYTVVQPAGASQSYTYAGEVRGRYETPLSFQVGGKVVRRYVELGSSVKRGDILLQLDPKDLLQTVSSSSAQVDSSQSQLKLAESNLARYRQLYAQNAISHAELDRYQSAYEVAAAASRQASAQYAQGSNQLDYSVLLADQPGIIAAVNVEVGQVISAGQAVLTIVHDGEREIEINVPENRLEELRQSKQIQVSFWALPQITLGGQIREISPMADKTSRTYKVRISLNNPLPEIKLGMTAAVAVGVDKTQPVFNIPLSAIYQNGSTPQVWIVSGETLRLRSVKVGNMSDGNIQVLEGLDPGDHVVTAGVHKLREGQKVRLSGGAL